MVCKRVLLLSFFTWVLCLSPSYGSAASAAVPVFEDVSGVTSTTEGQVYVCPYARGTEGIKVLVARKKETGRWFRYKDDEGQLTGFADDKFEYAFVDNHIIYRDGYPIRNYPGEYVLVGGGIAKKVYEESVKSIGRRMEFRKEPRTLSEAAYAEFFEETGVSIELSGEIYKFSLDSGLVGEGYRFVKLKDDDCYALYINVTKYNGVVPAGDSYTHLESVATAIQANLVHSAEYSLSSRPFEPRVEDDELARVEVLKAGDALSTLVPDWHKSLVGYLGTLKEGYV